MPNRALLTALAKAFLAGEPAVDQVISRASLTLAATPRWLPPLARRFVKAFPPGKIRPRHRDVVQFLLETPRFRRRKPAIENWLTEPPRMQPVAAARAWPIPPLETSGALAEWLQLTIAELEWLADLKGLSRHYHYRVLSKPSGAIRLIEAPKPRLKQLQRKILAEILEKIPPHAAVHGFLKGHSIKTFVAPHLGQRVVLKMDLDDFFPSIRGPRIQALFRTMGYPESVADLLGGICTTAAPHQFGIYNRPHLPQGAPTSPALANLCAYRVDCRLTGLAKSAGAVYTRYADDLAFSGGEEFLRCVERFSTHVAAILVEHGFAVHHRKTRVMRQSVRQHLAGLVANERLNIRRTDFDRLKATLTNCIRLGPESQNREAHPNFRLHLQGKVSFVESIHHAKGKRLRALFDQISS
jgi:retron-type reverse transcriptase